MQYSGDLSSVISLLELTPSWPYSNMNYVMMMQMAEEERLKEVGSGSGCESCNESQAARPPGHQGLNPHPVKLIPCPTLVSI